MVKDYRLVERTAKLRDGTEQITFCVQGDVGFIFKDWWTIDECVDVDDARKVLADIRKVLADIRNKIVSDELEVIE
ncbi:hypothetical protein GOV10_05315 [Candidatus Woesearchaeota archaeon]|nr:hypothetical protein [Candidatus Woesearchaeota archaeon]